MSDSEVERGATVIPLSRKGDPRRDDQRAQVTSDTSFEVDLDPEEERPQPGAKPVYVDVTYTDDAEKPIIPANLRTWPGIKSTVRRRVRRAAHVGGYHAARLPFVYLPQALFYAVPGAFLLAARLLGWWWDIRSIRLEQQAVNDNDHAEFHRARSQGNARRLFRGIVLWSSVLTVYVLVAAVLPTWALAALVVVVVPWLAHLGRPADKPIVTPAVVEPRYRQLRGDIVLRAYYAAKLGDPEKAPVRFGSRMSRDALDRGSEVVIDLDYGKTFEEVMTAKSKIASGLDVSVNQVFLTKDPTSERRHKLYVSDVDPLAIPAGRGPLVDLKPRDIWRPAPLGPDERGRLVALTLMWVSVLVGAQPRKGKTFSARLLALYAALDPYVRITIADGKDSPDWKMFRLIAHRLIMGTVAHKPGDPDPVEELLAALREIKKHIQQVNAFLSTLPVAECPDGKLTRELARKYPNLRVWLLVMEEFQIYYELDSKEQSLEIASLLSFIMAVGPSAGVIILSSSQKPSGVGAGQEISKLFTRYRDNHAVRFALKCGNRNVSEAVLGTEAYGEGHDASALPVGDGTNGTLDYRGVGILYGASDAVPRVRCFHINGRDAEQIVMAARRHREAAGTLTGLAAGEEIAQEFRDVLRDVRDVYRAGEAWISWKQLAERLADTLPERYADLTKESISAQIRGLGAQQKKGREGSATLWGVPLAEVEKAIEQREIEGRRA